MRSRQIALVCGITYTLAACKPSPEEVANGDDPMLALTSTAISTRYGQEYWTQQITADPRLWQSALAYCQGPQGPQSPNCGPVKLAKLYEAMRNAPAPELKPFRYGISR